jgi:hypothetical protein
MSDIHDRLHELGRSFPPPDLLPAGQFAQQVRQRAARRRRRHKAAAIAVTLGVVAVAALVIVRLSSGDQAQVVTDRPSPDAPSSPEADTPIAPEVAGGLAYPDRELSASLGRLVVPTSQLLPTEEGDGVWILTDTGGLQLVDVASGDVRQSVAELPGSPLVDVAGDDAILHAF